MGMKIYAPNYYGNFKCIAGACKHSCCIGWEIDIDEVSLERYRAISGELGERLKQNIEWNGECPHFITDDSDKCPFLNTDGLCDLIIAQGEEVLCDICREHPRFRNYFSDRVEIGLGMCCEAAAELILSNKDKVFLCCYAEEEDDAEEPSLEETEFFELRGRLMQVLQDRDMSISCRLEAVLRMVGAEGMTLDEEELKELFSSLEYMDEEGMDYEDGDNITEELEVFVLPDGRLLYVEA